MKLSIVIALLWSLVALNLSAPLFATETEHLDFKILPKPAPVVVDGDDADWDLSGGVFACGDVENSREKFAVWLHAMHDADNLYILARWIDHTPMNNPGSVKGDYGFNGDCLQIRCVTAPDVAADSVNGGGNSDDAPQMRTTHMTFWRDRDGADAMDMAWGRRFNEGSLKDAKTQGGQQAFKARADGKGYTHELAIPWKLLTKPGVTLKPGDRLLLTFEPNFTIGAGSRLTIKDVFKSGVGIDRIFTFQGNRCWGFASLEAQGKLSPRPVRLSDAREFPVRAEGRELIVDWTGVVKTREPEGFKNIAFNMPEDGYVSLNLYAPDGIVARQLLACAFYTKGEHTVKWDGLTTMSVRKPGEPLPEGDYKWEAIYHTGIGLRLRGWAGNSGKALGGNQVWGADHGNAHAAASDGNQVYLGWGAGEGAKPLQASDTEGNIKWKNVRGGIAGAGPIACDGKTVYAYNSVGGYSALAIYRVDARSGGYTEWTSVKSTDLTMKDIWGDVADVPKGPTALAAATGRVFASFHQKNAVAVIDSKTGKVQKMLTVPKPGDLEALSAEKLVAVSDKNLVSIDVESGEIRTLATLELSDGDWVSGLALDKSGNIYAGLRKAHVIKVFSPDGKSLRTIGRTGGRALVGPWTPDGLYNIAGMAIDGKGQLWVTEDNDSPRRVSVWDAETGAFKTEYFGATAYGANGGAINPVDPNLMVGMGCEWRIDPATGLSKCLGTICRDGMGSSGFAFGENGKLYLMTTAGFLHGTHPVKIYERLGEANYKLRTVLSREKNDKSVRVWADENDDGKEQENEVANYPIDLKGWFQGWYLSMSQDLSLYGTYYQAKVTGWTACGAPKYDLSKAVELPGPNDKNVRGGMGAQRGSGSADGKYMLWNSKYGEDHSTVDCYDIASGKLKWTYPSNFVGVHGSHRAVSAEVGMIRGAYDVVGSAKLPAPVGNIWVIPTNKGEWHALTEKGFYLTRFFEGDPMKINWPEKAAPGAMLDACPPGSGEEAFGGSISCSKDGKLSLQAGHVSFWNVEVTGLETVKSLGGGGTVNLSAEDVRQAKSFRDKYLQDASGAKALTIRKVTPTLTGQIDADFPKDTIVKFQKMASAAVRAALTYDAENLYAAWEVKDDTLWVNGADASEFLYARGDTVDLQLGTDAKAPAARSEPVLGDLRLSIGSFKGKPTAVIYRKVATEKNPKSFSSGVIKGYTMDSVIEVPEIKISVKTNAVKKEYTVEAVIPFKSLGFTPTPGQKIRGDIGVTHGNKAGDDTSLRTYWSNQQTGLVSDEVFELQMEPKNWGDLQFGE